MTFLFKFVTVSTYFIYPGKIVFQINTGNVIEKSAGVLEIWRYKSLPKCLG